MVKRIYNFYKTHKKRVSDIQTVVFVIIEFDTTTVSQDLVSDLLAIGDN